MGNDPSVLAASTLVDVLVTRPTERPDRLAYPNLPDAEVHTLTYGELYVGAAGLPAGVGVVGEPGDGRRPCRCPGRRS